MSFFDGQQEKRGGTRRRSRQIPPTKSFLEPFWVPIRLQICGVFNSKKYNFPIPVNDTEKLNLIPPICQILYAKQVHQFLPALPIQGHSWPSSCATFSKKPSLILIPSYISPHHTCTQISSILSDSLGHNSYHCILITQHSTQPIVGP